MGTNTLVYFGHYLTSFHRLHPLQDRYWKVDEGDPGATGQAIEVPPAKFDGGIHFGFMQMRTGFVIVRIGELVLPTPVLFVGGRHGPAAPGPSWAELDREASLNIIVDAIVANPAFRDHLMALATSQQLSTP
jgi:hypothetical protein